MAEYIERKKVLSKAAPVAGCFSNMISVYDVIMLPAVDVSPVRHGRWIDKGEYAVCMECGGRSGTQYDGVEPIPLMTQFCPNCGAKMDEEVSE